VLLRLTDPARFACQTPNQPSNVREGGGGGGGGASSFASNQKVVAELTFLSTEYKSGHGDNADQVHRNMVPTAHP